MRPIGGLTVVRRTWMEPGKTGKKASVEISFKHGSRDPEGGFMGTLIKTVAEKLRTRGHTVEIRGAVGSEMTVTNRKTQHLVNYNLKQRQITIEPASQKIGFLQERRLKKAAAKLMGA